MQKSYSKLILLLILVILIPSVISDTGGSITTDGAYTIHTFTTNGTYASASAKSIEILVVAGGGSAGSGTAYSGGSGGGGAGGLIYNSSFSLVAGNYSVVVGGGGVGEVNKVGRNGSNSSFSTFIALGGGGGGSSSNTAGVQAGRDGGSGGGSSGKNGASSGGSGLSGQGYYGGSALGTASYGGSGGGGAGGNGTSVAGGVNTGGAGGNGLNVSISGVVVCYAGGGGGTANDDVGGSANCGGGAGKDGGLGDGIAGVNGTGGGGGAGGYTSVAGGNGGSGVVIIRYATPASNGSVTFNANTTAEATYWNGSTSSIYASTKVNDFNAINTTINIYNSSGLYTSAVGNGNFSFNFSGLPPGTYYLNATITNLTANISTASTNTYIFYDFTINITNPHNLAINRTINITYEKVFYPSVYNMSYYNISLLNPDFSFNRTIKANNSNTTYYFWNISNDTTIKPGNYYLRVAGFDPSGNMRNDTANFTLLDTAPSAPAFVVMPSAFYYDYNSSFLANGSIDLDNDTVTVLYKITDVTAGIIRQSYNSQNWYIPILADIGHNLTITAIASTSAANSTEVSAGVLTYLTLANIFIIREKTNTLFNVSHADEMSISVICQDDVNTQTITNNSFVLPISCAYLYIKIDATFGNTSYFRIINPAYASFANISVYMLDLTLDTGVEMILTINDLTGDYSGGEVIIKRYINSSEVTIISYPVDIESSATLYLLKDALYTVTVKDNNGNSRVLGNLIASAAGEKIITLPDINFYPIDAVFGEQINWSYEYYTNTTSGYIQLIYDDRGNSTINITFIIVNNSNNAQVFGSTSSNSSHATFTYVFTDVNATYMSNLTINRAGVNTIFEQKIFYPGSTVMPGSETSLFENAEDYLFWIALIFIFLIGLAFSATNSKIGLVVVMFFLFMFISWKWLNFGASTWIVFGLFGVLVIFNLISKSKEVKD